TPCAMPLVGNPDASLPPYRNALSAWVGSALLAAAVVAGADIGLTLRGAGDWTGSQGARFAAGTLSLYRGGGLVLGAFEGLVFGAIAATHPGTAAYRRLARDPAHDREVTGALLAFVVAAVGFAAIVAALSIRLVAVPERK